MGLHFNKQPFPLLEASWRAEKQKGSYHMEKTIPLPNMPIGYQFEGAHVTWVDKEFFIHPYIHTLQGSECQRRSNWLLPWRSLPCDFSRVVKNVGTLLALFQGLVFRI